MLFIKRFSDFETVAALTPLSSSLCIDSAEQALHRAGERQRRRVRRR